MPLTDSRPVLLATHIAAGDSGEVGLILDRAGIAHETLRLNKGQPLPPVRAHYRGLVSFGGVQSATDDHLDYIAAELRWLEHAIAAGFPVFGICLGAQILARFLGGTVEGHPEGFHEIGYYKVTPSPAGQGLFDDEQHFYQWHSEGFTLPNTVEHLARSELFPNQAFRVGNAYGLQFHPDVTAEMMQRWSTKAAHRMVLPGAQARDRQHAGQATHGDRIDAWSHRFFGHWLAPSLATTQTVMAGSD